jgi:hypothetical protein
LQPELSSSNGRMSIKQNELHHIRPCQGHVLIVTGRGMDRQGPAWFRAEALEKSKLDCYRESHSCDNDGRKFVVHAQRFAIRGERKRQAAGLHQ